IRRRGYFLAGGACCGAAHGRAAAAGTSDQRAAGRAGSTARAGGVEAFSRSARTWNERQTTLLGTDGILEAGRLVQKSALQHPIDLGLELGRLIGLDARPFGAKAVFA